MHIAWWRQAFAMGDSGTVKETKCKRVSFACVDTVHIIPRNDDLRPPSLVLNAALLSLLHNNPLFAIAEAPAPQPATHRLPTASPPATYTFSTADPDLHSGSHSHEHSAGFTCNTGIDQDFTARTISFDGLEYDNGCFVHHGHISRPEDDDSIVKDVINDDLTMDTTTISLKSDIQSDLQGTDPLGQVASPENANDSDSQSADDLMALTKPGASYWVLVYPQDISLHVDNDQCDQYAPYWALVYPEYISWHACADQRAPYWALVYPEYISWHAGADQGAPYWALVYPEYISWHAGADQRAPYWAIVYPQDESLHTDDDRSDQGASYWALVYPEYVPWHEDDDQSDMSLATGTSAKTLPMCNIEDLVLDQTDHLTSGKQSREAVSSGNIGPDNIQLHSHSHNGHSDLQSSGCNALASPLSKKEDTVDNGQDISLHANNDQSDISLGTGRIFNNRVPMCNLEDHLLDQANCMLSGKQSEEVVFRGKVLESCNFDPNSIQPRLHSKHDCSDLDGSDCRGLGSPLNKKEKVVENAQDISLNADDDQTRMPLCNLKGDLLDEIDHTISREPKEFISTRKVSESCTFDPSSTQSCLHSKHGHSDLRSSGYGGFGSPVIEKESIVENAQDVSMHADDDQSDMTIEAIFDRTVVPMCNLNDNLVDQTDHTLTRDQVRGIEDTEKTSSVKEDHIFSIRDPMTTKSADSAAGKEVIKEVVTSMQQASQESNAEQQCETELQLEILLLN